MDDFFQWLKDNNISSKVISDHRSRLNRLQTVFEKVYGKNFSFEDQFKKDKFDSLFFLLRKKGNNPELTKFAPVNLPIGSTTMASIRYSLRTYCRYLETVTCLRSGI